MKAAEPGNSLDVNYEELKKKKKAKSEAEVRLLKVTAMSKS